VVDADPDVAVPRVHTGNPEKDDVAIVVLALLDIGVYDAEVLVAFPNPDKVVEMEGEDEVMRGVTEEVLVVDEGKDDVKSMDEVLRDVVEGVRVVVAEVVRENAGVELVLVVVDVLEAKLDELELIVTDELRVEADELDDSGIVTVTVGGLTLTSITEYAVEITVAGDEVIVTKTV
jgi:hypothetical protein